LLEILVSSATPTVKCVDIFSAAANRLINWTMKFRLIRPPKNAWARMRGEKS
jgi:hypothetical protein